MDRTALHGTITRLCADLSPHDDLGRSHQRTALNWLASTSDIFRRAKPATPDPHLVSYFLAIDRADDSVLLCNHRLAGLWLPTGGHVEPGEHPYATVRREAVEELGITAEPDPVFGVSPFFLTVTQTKDVPARRHTDVTLWFALPVRSVQELKPDEREFTEVRWWRPKEIRETDPARFDPHLSRALQVLRPGP